jgi:bifunctional ADP-heptose synthase (sugar kinase/adenylyltransferase)
METIEIIKTHIETAKMLFAVFFQIHMNRDVSLLDQENVSACKQIQEMSFEPDSEKDKLSLQLMKYLTELNNSTDQVTISQLSKDGMVKTQELITILNKELTVLSAWSHV